MKVLNIFKLNIYQLLIFMFKIKRDTAPAAFQNDFPEISPWYRTVFSQSNLVERNILSSQTNFFVSRSKALE